MYRKSKCTTEPIKKTKIKFQTKTETGTVSTLEKFLKVALRSQLQKGNKKRTASAISFRVWTSFQIPQCLKIGCKCVWVRDMLWSAFWHLIWNLKNSQNNQNLKESKKKQKKFGSEKKILQKWSQHLMQFY